MSVLVVVEVVLLVIVLAKLAFDVWHYHKTGEMPWLARNICLGLSYSGTYQDLLQIKLQGYEIIYRNLVLPSACQQI